MGKVSVVTGGTAGIGAGIVKKILEHSGQDDKIFVNYGHNEERAREFWENLSLENREKVVLLKADLSSYERMLEFVAAIKERTDHVDWLVCNAGVGTYARFEDYTFEEWTRIVNTNLSVPVFLVKELLDVMSKGGRILFMGSYAGKQAYSSSLVYSVSKAGVLFLAKGLVKELEPKGITVNALAPGFIETGWQKDRTPESYERVNKKIALHRFGEVEEVADMAYHVLNNPYMNGSVVEIHGGYDFF